MRRVLGLSTLLCVCALPLTAAAGGSEFPSGGTRELGRGATGFTRADDPTIMARNPALLADLWDDQAMSGAEFLLVDACFRPTGGYSGRSVSGDDVIRTPDGKDLFLQAPKGATDLNGKPISGYLDEPYPTVCYSGAMPILPQLALARKLSSKLGVGLGFLPPDAATLNGWGRRDGWIDTPNGFRPNPTRYFSSHLNVSYFSALAAAGYRVSDFLRLGFGFQWNVAAFEATNWARPTPDLTPRNDVRVDTFGRDLFIPGIIASAHFVPTDNLDIAVGFKWSDRVRTKAKLDLTTGALGTGAPFSYRDAHGAVTTVTGAVPYTSHNQQGTVDSLPIWAPQLTFGARYAKRITPRVYSRTWDEAHLAAGRHVEDSMATELWDVEANAVVYFNGVSDKQIFTSDARSSAQVVLKDAQPGGVIGTVPANVGTCTKLDANKKCIGSWVVPTQFHGKTQLSLRAGGDYNVLPGLFTVRAGVSFETDGQDVEYLNITDYMLGRVGLHAGITMRIAEKTDFSVGYAHFIQKNVRLDPNPISDFQSKYRDTAAERAKYNYDPKNADGIARLEVPYGAVDKDVNGPNFVNAGSFFYHLDVVSVTLSQHF